jgi:hypothetical protein
LFRVSLTEAVGSFDEALSVYNDRDFKAENNGTFFNKVEATMFLQLLAMQKSQPHRPGRSE